MTKNMSEILLSSLPSFWKIARSFIEGKFKRVPLTLDHGDDLLTPTTLAVWLKTKRSAMQPNGA